MKKIFRHFYIGFFLFLIFLKNLSAQEDKLFSEDELLKQATYSSVEQAFRNYDKAYRLILKGTEGYYGKVDAIHPRIDSLIHLQYLYVVNESLDKLPESIGSLKNMQYLYLSGNKLSFIPDTVCSLKHLKRLDLRANQLKRIPEKIGKLSELEFFYIHDNRDLDFIPVSELAKLKKLKVINAKGTKIPRIQLEKLQELIPQTRVEY